jgi:hypothetical protein
MLKVQSSKKFGHSLHNHQRLPHLLRFVQMKQLMRMMRIVPSSMPFVMLIRRIEYPNMLRSLQMKQFQNTMRIIPSSMPFGHFG